jgi:hypothetical protein
MTKPKVDWNKIGKGISSTGTYIAENKKPLLYVGGAVAIVVVGWTVVNKFKKAVKGKSIRAGKFIEQNIDVKKLTITPQQAQNYAEQLFEAMNYDWGTDKAQIRNVFQKINAEDFKLVFNAFGKRDYGTLGKFSPTAFERMFGLYRSLDLVNWLNEDLDFLDWKLRAEIRKVIEPAGFVI